MDNLSLSCEFFPTATEKGAENLKKVREEFKKNLNLQYVSITYGAGGSNQDRTFDLVKKIIAEKNYKVVSHLTCVGAKKEELLEILNFYKELGVWGIMALRGDLPEGVQLGDLKTASELVSFIKNNFGDVFKIFVASYPEMHPKALNFDEDLKVLKNKFDMGAQEAVSQYFFNPDAFLFFRDEALKKGIKIPLSAGIMPIMNYKQLANFSDNCGADLPKWIRNKLAQYENDHKSLLDFGAEVVAKICQRLLAEGVNCFHFYSMNKSEAVLEIAKKLQWIKKQ